MKQTAFWPYCCHLAAKSCLTLCDPMNCSPSGSCVLHHRPEHAQMHVHRVGDAIQPSHPLSHPSPPALSLSQHQRKGMSQLFTPGGQTG